MENFKNDLIDLFENEDIEKSTIMGKELLEKFYKENKISEEEYNELKLFIQQQIKKYKQNQRRKNAIVNYLNMRNKKFRNTKINKI